MRQEHLDQAEDFQREIDGSIDRDRMVYVAGYNKSTFCGILKASDMVNDSGYAVTLRGDGTVPHALGLIDGVKTFYVDEEHAKLPGNGRVLAAITELLQTGGQRDESNLFFGLADNIRGAGKAEDQMELHSEDANRRRTREDQAALLSMRLQSRGAVNASVITPEEQALADLLLTHEPLPGAGGAAVAALGASAAGGVAASANAPAPPVTPVSLRIAIRTGHIQEIEMNGGGGPPIDAIAVGHYMGVRPSGAEWMLDGVVSPWASGADHVLVQFHDRGILRGTLGQPFFLPDPRPGHEHVLLAIMGMGPIGGFGIPELAVVVRELTYSLPQLGKQHLASVLIGASRDNLSPADALHAFLLGLQRTLTEAAQGNTPCLKQLTLVAQKDELRQRWRAR